MEITPEQMGLLYQLVQQDPRFQSHENVTLLQPLIPQQQPNRNSSMSYGETSEDYSANTSSNLSVLADASRLFQEPLASQPSTDTMKVSS